jgi:hypothetical protein
LRAGTVETSPATIINNILTYETDAADRQQTRK